MTVVIVFEEDGKAKFLANVKFAGSEEEPWNPCRVEMQLENFSGIKMKPYLMRDGLEELATEGGKLVIFPEKRAKLSLPLFVPSEPKRRVIPTHVAYVSSLNERCGIATYTNFLSEQLGKVFPVKLCGTIQEAGPTALLHVQHEFGIFPYSDELVSKRIESNYKVCTWHTVLRDPEALLEHYGKIDHHYDAHIVHNALAKKYLKAYVYNPVHIVPHGTVIFKPTPRDKAKRKLGLPTDRKMVFCFGFAAESKGFEEIAEVASRMKDTLFVISAAVHGIVGGHSKRVLSRLKATAGNNVLVLGKFLNEVEINLYASASDCLLFNYKTPRFLSSASGAMHRVLAAGKPIVGSVDGRLIELEDGHHALKYQRGDVDEMVHCLALVLDDHELASELGRNARRLAEQTSWSNVAKMHMNLYNKLVGEVCGPDWYDGEYFVGSEGGKAWLSENGFMKRWSYYNPTGEWLGAEPVMQVLKQLLNPKNMLSVGCGRGTFCAYAKDLGIDVTGIDFSKWAIEHPHPRARGLIQLGDIRNIQFPDRSFDLIFASDIMEHIYLDDLDKGISEIQRVSRRWVFYNIATIEEGKGIILKRGELPPKEYQAITISGHVTVMPATFWRKRLAGKGWRLRDDLVEKFKGSVPPEVLTNWELIIITQRVG